MNVRLTRDSVAMGDDCDAPHERIITVPDSAGMQEIIETVLGCHYLARISGGQATWSVASGGHIAVVAQQWPTPKMLPEAELVRPNYSNGTLLLHFTYYAQENPDTVYQGLTRRQFYSK
jgi:hypothetical protein